MIAAWHDAHASEIAALLDAVYPSDPLARDLADVHGLDRDGEGRFRRTLVATRSGRIAGAGTVREADLHPSRWRLSIQVHPSARRAGVGTALMDALVHLATESDGRRFQGATRADDMPGLAFLRRHGFVPLMRTRLGWLDLTAMAADRTSRFDAATRTVEALDYRVVAFSDRPEMVAAQRVADLHGEAYARTHAGWNPVRPLDAAERRDLFLGDDLIPDALFLALDGDAVAGFASLRHGRTPDEFDLGWAGIAADHDDRATAIVTALVGRCLDVARRRGNRVSVEVDDADPVLAYILDTLPVAWEPDWLAFARPGPSVGDPLL